MKIIATCECCSEENAIIKNYEMKKPFNQKTEFGMKLYDSLVNHLSNIEKICQSQGHYNKITVKFSQFSNEEKQPFLKELLKEFIPEKKKKEKEDKKHTLKEWLEEKKITDEEYEKLKLLLGEEKEKESLSWEAVQKLLDPERPPNSPRPTPPHSPRTPPYDPPPHQFPLPKSPPFSRPPTPHYPHSHDKTKTIKEWYENYEGGKQLTHQEYKLLITPWREEREGDLFIHEVVLDNETPYSWEEIQDYLRRAKESKRKEEEKKRREEEIKQKMKDDKDWSSIHLNFPKLNEDDYWKNKRKKAWISCGFDYSQTRSWINAGGITADEEGAYFATWLRDEIKIDPIEFLNDSSRMEDLKEQYKEWLDANAKWNG